MMLSLRKLNLLKSTPYLKKSSDKFIRNIGPIGNTRHFWGFKKDDDDDDGNKTNSSNEEKSGTTKTESKRREATLVSPFGDASPEINPLLILPINRRPLFPGSYSIVPVHDQKVIEAVQSAKGPFYLGLFLRKDPAAAAEAQLGDSINDPSELYTTGTFAQFNNMIKNPDSSNPGTVNLLVQNHRRINLKNIRTLGPPIYGEVSHWKRQTIPEGSSKIIKAYINEILSNVKEIFRTNQLYMNQLDTQNFYRQPDLSDPYSLVDVIGHLLQAEGAELQKLLETVDIEDRLKALLDLLAKEREVTQMQQSIAKKVEDRLLKQQREYYLKEQMKQIKKELGLEKDDKDDLMAKYNDQLKEIESRKLPPNANQQSHEFIMKTIKDEMKKLESLEKNSPEFNVTRSYLDWLFSIPWGSVTTDVLDLDQAKIILDEDHYGLEEIKSRILEFIAVGKLRGSVTGKIICFIGPPGVGKTSIAKSIARALDRKFFRFSVGGLTDTAEIKGHRRTYIGAMPGKPIQCLKTTKCMNPLILIDEIDKLGKNWNGDPASALLELLDPNQNFSFVDHYLDVPVDFSNALFVCTANDESTIPGPLRDRMEIIRLTGYDIQEKVAIASRYLVPKALKEAGLVKDKEHEEIKPKHNPEDTVAADDNNKVHEKVNKDNIEPTGNAPTYVFTDDTLEQVIKKYCRESGVRSLEKTIDKIARKLAFIRVQELEKSKKNSTTEVADANAVIEIKKDELEKYIGKPIFVDDTMFEDSETKGLPVGVVLGLAWNPVGGSPIYIETVAVPCAPSERDSGVHMVTGQLGDVMKESVNIAYTYARRFIMEKDKENKFYNSHQLHLHVPEGAVSKDGPSAGVAMTTSFISLGLNRSIKSNVAMTGELSLTGKVLPVGGIKEKTLAAKRAGAKTVILPFNNKRDYDELPEYVKADITVHFAKEYSDVYKVVFPDPESSSTPQQPAAQ